MSSAQNIPATHEIESAFVALLQESSALADEDIVPASNRESVVLPEHIFVYCPTVTPIPPNEHCAFADVTVAVVGDMDETSHATRMTRMTAVAKVLTQDPQPFGLQGKLWVCGWTLKGPRETSEGRQLADVYSLRVAVSLSSPGAQ